jgi:hypothetical protein
MTAPMDFPLGNSLSIRVDETQWLAPWCPAKNARTRARVVAKKMQAGIIIGKTRVRIRAIFMPGKKFVAGISRDSFPRNICTKQFVLRVIVLSAPARDLQ